MTEVTQRQIGRDRELVLPVDQFRASDFRAGLIISGAVASNQLDVLSGGGRLYAVTTSSVVRVRPLNLELWNNEAGWVEVEVRDGGTNGGRVLGPYLLTSRSEKRIPAEDLQGKNFTSSVHLQVLSGWVAQPLSNGLKVNLGFVLEPLDLFL